MPRTILRIANCLAVARAFVQGPAASSWLSRRADFGLKSVEAPPEKPKIPVLPKDALVIISPDEATWNLEKKEYVTLETEADSPTSFTPVLESFELNGAYYHAFPNSGTPLRKVDFPTLLMQDDGVTPLSLPVADAVRLTLLRDLLDAVRWVHLQGLPHISLDDDCVRIYKEAPKGKRRGFWRLQVVGLGAGPQLAARTTVFQLNNESWPYNPPESLSGALLQGNLPGLYAWDAWSVGTLVTMLVGGYSQSPFSAEPDLRSLTFSSQDAVNKKIKKTFTTFSDFLTQLNLDSNGFLFRYGWLTELVVGLLKMDPDQRMSLTEAWEIMSASNKSPQAKKAAGANQELGRFSADSVSGGAPPGADKVPEMKPERRAELRVVFDRFDADKNGAITVEEIMLAMNEAGTTVTQEQVSRMIVDFDSDGNGELDFDEFVNMMKDRDLKEASAKNVFGVQFSSTKGEPFRSLEAMISIADKGLCEIIIDDRSVVTDSRGGGSREGLKNYGEIVGFRNRADGDRWDIVAPGLDEQLTAGSRHRLSKLLGVIMIKGGNHKLVVALNGARPDGEKVNEDIRKFIDTYSASHENVRTNRRVWYLELEDPFERPVGSLDPSQLNLGGVPESAKKPNDGESWLMSSFGGEE